MKSTICSDPSPQALILSQWILNVLLINLWLTSRDNSDLPHCSYTSAYCKCDVTTGLLVCNLFQMVGWMDVGWMDLIY